jgi:hypothetical protein
MEFSVSRDVGGQAVSALEALLTRQLEEAQAAEAKRANQAREAQASERLSFDRERFTADQDARQQDIEQESIDGLRKNNDRMDARLTRLQGEEDQMDKDAAIQKILEALTPQQWAIQQLGGKLSMNDLKTPEQVKAEADARVEQVRREAEARASAEAKYRPAPAAKSAGAATTPPGGCGNETGGAATPPCCSSSQMKGMLWLPDCGTALRSNHGRSRLKVQGSGFLIAVNDHAAVYHSWSGVRSLRLFRWRWFA